MEGDEYEARLKVKSDIMKTIPQQKLIRVKKIRNVREGGVLLESDMAEDKKKKIDS